MLQAILIPARARKEFISVTATRRIAVAVSSPLLLKQQELAQPQVETGFSASWSGAAEETLTFCF